MANPWNGERCEYCDGPIAARKVDVARHQRRGLVLIRGVPAGVCRRCGARYFEGAVAKQLDGLLRSREGERRKVVAVPVLRYAEG
jgi:YgiT-type zinc finger domain-containing protein